jgi:lipoprotein-anchoring transpeptidase ErfK/SrfK
MSADLRSRRFCGVILFASLLTVPAVPACAQSLSYMPVDRYGPAHPQYAPQTQQPGDVTADELPAPLRRQVVAYQTNEPAGTVIIDTAHTFLYLTLGDGKAMRYGIGVGREGFTWSGVETISRKAEWPDWIPPAAMVARQPYLPRWVGGGPGNPLGARALYLGTSDYRIHGTNDPTSIGKPVSSGCIRLRNEDVTDLYERIGVGTRVVVLPNDNRRQAGQKVSQQTNPQIGQRAASGVMTAQIPVRPAADRIEPRAAANSGAAVSGIY